MAAPSLRCSHCRTGGTGCNVRRAQRGVTLLLTMLLLVVAASFVLASKLNASSRTTYRDERTAAVLAQAKDALISFAATYPDQFDRTQGPGQLPCPDTDNPPDALPNSPCGGAVPIRRLPWQLFGMNDLRDSSGEELWYAVSANYRNNPKAPGQLNSNTPGQLTLDGTGDIVALIIAPGPSLPGQNRPSNNIGDYLEGDNSNGDATFVTGANLPFNDHVMPISRAELMRAVQKRVLAEAQAALRQFRVANGYYPFVSHLGPDYYPQVGDCGDEAGNDDLLPLTDSPIGELAVSNIPFPAPYRHWFRSEGWSDLMQYQVGRASSRNPGTNCAGSPAGEQTVRIWFANGPGHTIVP